MEVLPFSELPADLMKARLPVFQTATLQYSVVSRVNLPPASRLTWVPPSEVCIMINASPQTLKELHEVKRTRINVIIRKRKARQLLLENAALH